MKKYYKYLLCLLLPCCWQCADFIDVQPENNPTYTNYFKSEKDAEALLAALEIHVNNVCQQSWNSGIADPAHKYFYGQFIQNMLNPEFCIQSWQAFADLVYQTNIILDNAHRFPLPKEVIEPYVLQAHFAKGIAYFYMARVFSEAPIFPNSVTFEKVPQVNGRQLLEEAEKNMLEAMKLPVYDELVTNSSYKRMKQYGCKGAAAAFLAHIYAWRAGVEGDSEYWSKAEEYCSMIIDGKVGNYNMAADPEEVCTQVMKGDSQESIWELYGNATESTSYAWNHPSVGFPILTTGYAYPGAFYTLCLSREKVREMYPMGDLRRNSFYWATDADYIYLNDVDGEIVPGLEPIGDPIEVFDLNDIAQNSTEIPEPFSESYFYKFRNPFYTMDEWIMQPKYFGLSQNKVVFRLAGIYLLRAECRARQNKAHAVEDLNIVRARAYGNLSYGMIIDQSKAQEYSFPSADDVKNGLADNIQLAIFREREKELIYEGHRYYDIARNGMCFIRGEDSYDYIRKEISPAYARLTDQDIKDGALYSRVDEMCFKNNDLIRQNKYWNRRIQ